MLERINHPSDIKNLIPSELDELARELRDEIILTTSKNGGHLASSLGTVELTIALLKSLDFEKNDKVIWDVGHQSYAYKILTDRKDKFHTLRTIDGISGFPRRDESKYDVFGAGHSSTSISAGLGFCVDRDLHNRDETIVSVIGDGSLTGGEAFEGLNNASKLKSNFIIILNDNDMSISKNIGGLHSSLDGVRTSYNYLRVKEVTKKILGTIPLFGQQLISTISSIKNAFKQIYSPRGMIFENMDIVYIGAIDGHNIQKMYDVIERAKKIKKTTVVHIKTKKGCGYNQAEEDPERFHGIGPFIIETGEDRIKSNKSYTSIFSDKLCELAYQDSRICALTAAMESGTGLTRFAKEFPDRFFDTGIEEQHTVTFAASLAASGLKPFVCIYSTFLQRAYDQIVHDVALQKLPVIFCIDRAGMVGADGETHQGIFDLSYLCSIPNIVVMAPKNAFELEKMLEFALKVNKPIAIRYPRGEAYFGLKDKCDEIILGKAEKILNGEGIAVFSLGRTMSTAEHIIAKLKTKGYNPTLINARFASPIDKEIIDEICKKHHTIISLEENVKRGGVGEAVADYICEKGYNVRFLNESLPNEFITHGDVNSLRKRLKVDSDSIVSKILQLV